MTVVGFNVGSRPVKVFGDVDANALEQLKACMLDERAVAGALMADGHLGYSMPIGGVIAYDQAISPSGVGFDIGCGNKAVKTDIHLRALGVSPDDGGAGAGPFDTVPDVVKPIMREIQRSVAFGMGRKNPTPVDHALFDADVWPDLLALSPGLKETAAAQLGTVGSGNHYVDLLVDEEGWIWIACHFGSRGLGHKIATGFLNLAVNDEFSARTAERDEPTVLSLQTDLGHFYLDAMKLAGVYAYAGRDYVIQQVLNILGAQAVEEVHNHHNYAWFDDGLWVVRKGATPLTYDLAFIGGSMGDDSVIVRGTSPEHDLEIGALGSAPHGAGRVMSRTKAAGKIRRYWVCPNQNCDFVPIRTEGGQSGHKANHCPKCSIPLRRERMRDTSDALIDWDAVRADLTARGIVVLGAGADEAPGVYKSLQAVIAAHSNIEIVHRLRPIGVVMAGADEYDPYRD